MTRCNECTFRQERSDGTHWCDITLPPWLIRSVTPIVIGDGLDEDIDKTVGYEDGCDLGLKE